MAGTAIWSVGLQVRSRRRLLTLLVAAALASGWAASVGTPVRAVEPAGFVNPLPVRTPTGDRVESCADPSVIRGHGDDAFWYMYCTMDPLNDADRDDAGHYVFHRITMYRSTDLVHWRYMGDAFDGVPAWGDEATFMWAPEIDYIEGRYHLYYAMTNTTDSGGGSDSCEFDPAIGVATSDSPLGPWVDSGQPVVEPHAIDANECDYLATIDPEVIATPGGQRYIYFGSFYGGLAVRELGDHGLRSRPATEAQVLLPERGEAPEIVRHEGWYYFFYSAATCCDSATSGYIVMAGRSASPTGPFVDQQGRSLLAARVGGTPVLGMNGNRWLGPGHNTVFQDLGGQSWTIYHAVDRNDPHFDGQTFFTKRPAMLDPLDWPDGWPQVRSGRWASDKPMSGPAARPGEVSGYHASVPLFATPGLLLSGRSDEFSGASVDPAWTWVRRPPAGTTGVANGRFRFETQDRDLYLDSNDASILTRPVPRGEYIVETRMRLDLPTTGDVWFNQAGLVIYGSDDRYLKLVHLGIGPSRQTEFGKEDAPDPDLYPPRFGTTRAGPPGLWTWLRIVKTDAETYEKYEAWSSSNGTDWVRGATWTHSLGAGARIGLVAMGGSGYTAEFDYVRVSRVAYR